MVILNIVMIMVLITKLKITIMQLFEFFPYFGSSLLFPTSYTHYADEDDNDVDGDDDNVDGDNGNADGDDDDAD